MPLTIGSNISSLIAQRKLVEGTSGLERVYERLSSGQRINRASDDAAGLSISESLKSNKRVFNQGIRNFNDGISLLNIADSALESLSNIVLRIKELAEQSANGTYSYAQRDALDTEAQALSKEYGRIVHSTKFNGISLFNGSIGEGTRIQGGYGLDGSILAGVGGAVGEGTFQSAVTYIAEAQRTDDVTIGDLNGDGIMDLVTVGSNNWLAGEGYASVRLGNGDGSFGTITSYYINEARGNSVKLGDMNNDGVMDLIAIGDRDPNGGTITILTGNGDGTFGARVTYSVIGRGGDELELGDVNGDGNLDVVSAQYDGAMSVMLGSGTGTLSLSQNILTGMRGVTGARLADLNNDGLLDIVSSGYTIGLDGFGIVSLGNGDGTFQSAVTYAAETTRSMDVAIGDLNGDGIIDMVTGGTSTGGGFSVRLGIGDGTFGAQVAYAESNLTAIHSVELSDLNGDGLLDLVASGASGLIARLGDGQGSFGTATSYNVGAVTIYGITASDVNGDGVPDLIAGADGAVGFAGVFLADTTQGTSPLLPFSLKNAGEARQTLSLMNQKMEQLSNQRGVIGSFQSRIGVGINVLAASSENYGAAESRLRDADIAHESSQLIRLNILQQAASSVLAQANLQPEISLALISG